MILRRTLLLLAAPAAPGRRAAARPRTRRAACSRTAAPTARTARLKQALDNFKTIVHRLPEHRLRGRRAARDRPLPPGGRAATRPRRATAFEQVTKRFPQSDGAPGAYYYLGRLTLERATTAAELDDALAQFARVQRLYPRSEWVPRALYATGLAHRKARTPAPRPSEAARRVALEYPTSDAAPAAQFEVGQDLALLGEPRQAMEEFQQVRNRFPESEWAPRALDRITALYRLYGAGKPTFAARPVVLAWAPATCSRTCARILMTPDAARSWVASDKVKSAVPFGARRQDGRRASPARTCRACASRPSGELRGGGDAGGAHGPARHPDLHHPRATSRARRSRWRSSRRRRVTPGGTVLVADEKRKKVYRFDAKYQYQGPFPDAKEREVSAHACSTARAASCCSTATRRRCASLDETGKRAAHACRRAAPATSSGSPWTWPSTPSATSTSRTRRAGCSSSRRRAQLLTTLGGGGRAQAARGDARPVRRRPRVRRQAAADPEVPMSATSARLVLLVLRPRSWPPRAARAQEHAAPPRARSPTPCRRSCRRSRTCWRAPPRSSTGPQQSRSIVLFDEIVARLEVLRRQGTLPPRGREILAPGLRAARPRVLQHRPAGEGGGQLPRRWSSSSPQYAISKEKVSPKVVDFFNSVKKALVGYLAVSSSPPGARVTLNGEFLSLTDFFPLEVLAGEYTVEIARDGYRTETRTLSIAPQGDGDAAGGADAHAGQRVLRDRAGRGRDLGGRPAARPRPAASRARSSHELARAQGPRPRARLRRALEVGNLSLGAHKVELRRKCYETVKRTIEVPEAAGLRRRSR